MRLDSDSARERVRGDLLKQLRACVRTNVVTLSSGRETDFYLDGREITLDPRGLELVSSLAFDVLRGRCDAVGGPAAAAIPIVAGIGLCALEAGVHLRMFFVRPQAKTHGLGRRIEGPPLKPSDRVALVDDVATTGGSLLRTADALREEVGIRPHLALVIVDREEGAQRALRETEIELVALFRRTDI